MFPIDLTPSESDVLNHRLEVPDCLADALAEDYHPEDVEEIAGHLLARDYAAAVAISQKITHAVLADCVNGSTYAAAAYSRGYTMADKDNSAQAAAWRAAVRAGRSLAKKVSALIGEPVAFPTM